MIFFVQSTSNTNSPLTGVSFFATLTTLPFTLSLSKRGSLKTTTQKKRCVEATGKASVQVRETLHLKSARSRNPFSSHRCILRHKDSEDKACLGELWSGPGFFDSQERKNGVCLAANGFPPSQLSPSTVPLLRRTNLSHPQTHLESSSLEE
ncbi:hypothetical protein QOT17_025489 [Balamuthia mandrillaris]